MFLHQLTTKKEVQERCSNTERDRWECFGGAAARGEKAFCRQNSGASFRAFIVAFIDEPVQQHSIMYRPGADYVPIQSALPDRSQDKDLRLAIELSLNEAKRKAKVPRVRRKLS